MKTNETNNNQFKVNGETFKLIPNSMGYFVSDLGNVCRKKYFTEPHTLLKQTLNKVGYLCVSIYYNVEGKAVKKYWQSHRLAYSVFNGEIPNRLVINHKDLDKTNNNITNLEMVTSKQNKDHSNTLRGFTPYHTILEKDGVKTVCKTHREVQDILGLELRVHVISILTHKEYNGYKITKKYKSSYK